MPEGEFKEYKKTITDNKDTIEIEKLKGDVSTGPLLRVQVRRWCG